MEHIYLIWTQQQWDFLVKAFFIVPEAYRWLSQCHDLSLQGFWKIICPDGHSIFSLWQRKYWSSLWDAADDHPVVGNGYWPQNILDEKSCMLFYFDWSQRLMIWYGLQPSWLFVYEDVYWVFVVVEVKYSVYVCLYELHQITLVFYTKLIYSLNVSFAHRVCCCFIVCNHFNCFIYQN